VGSRMRPAAGLAPAVALSGVMVGLASAMANASPTGSAAVVAAVKRGAVEGPFDSGADCSSRTRQYTDSTGFFHFCRYKDGTDGFAAGWWVWLYN
jgi:hypothetical protein